MKIYQNNELNPQNSIYHLLGVVEALKDLIETKQVLLKQIIPYTLRRLYEKQIFSTADRIDYLEEMVLSLREELESSTKKSKAI